MKSRFVTIIALLTAWFSMPGQTLAGVPASGTPADPAPAAVAASGDSAHGKQLFNRYCVVCHGAAGSGGLGPSLKKIESRLSGPQIAHQITEPRAAMPRLYPAPLTEDDVRDVVSYVQTL
ncbi:Cytochrome c-551 precursor [Caballeronia catudaia]|uniref:Cytochrome c-551 n=1 Tax=Caballeronia catudaia TaxID=1777136 RepID=A0A158DLU9_9BURK|nr:cytochrome c [Caballeronia catudaia]SAK95564.1 Cytochrome c-551 precursor [Caballeronia catudaia]